MSALSDAMMRGLQRLPWHALPRLFAVVGLVGVTSPLWRTCTSISDRSFLVLLGAFALACAAVFAVLIASWEEANASLGKRLRQSALLLLCVGALATVVIPNLIGAVDRGDQKRTMGDMRTLATAIESYRIGTNMYPALSVSTPADMDALAALLEPTYVKQVPRKDAWGTPFLVRSDGEHYAIVSLGCCGEPDVGDPFTLPEGGTNQFRADLMFRDGSFVRYPDGEQR